MFPYTEHIESLGLFLRDDQAARRAAPEADSCRKRREIKAFLSEMVRKVA